MQVGRQWGLTFPSDLFPAEVVASVKGLSGFAAGLAGTGFTLLVGVLLNRFSYFPAFLLAVTAPVLATVVVVFRLPRNEQRQNLIAPVSLQAPVQK